MHLFIADEIVDERSLREYERTVLPRVMMGFLSHGITTVRSTGDPLPYIAELRDRMDSAPTGPRVVITGPTPSSPGGHPAVTVCRGNPFCRQTLAREIENEEQARQAIGELARADVDAVKIIVDDLVAPGPLSDAIVAALVDEAHRNELRIIAHVSVREAVPTAKRLIELGLDEFVHLFPVPAEDADVAGLLARMNVPVTTTVSIFDAYRDTTGAERSITGGGIPYTPALRARFVASLMTVHALEAAGVKLVVGTDWSQPREGRRARPEDKRFLPGARTLHEMELLRRAGLSTSAILMAATANAAEALGRSDDIGTITEGKLADLVILDGDLLADFAALQHTAAVLKGGRLVFGALPIH